ncbi:hypothetical protein GCM10028803_13990 [Larkinella knui]|uniref:T9SS C-terminal target domain-containing protein n=1 Tax=Larkinella knui TaxID=2025310 RepID=A0A3P1CBL5_9BACT|nr:hypothetical protein [Larkinella knui]RRB10655.1 hypothetical protein EHT87_26200 [Larkinella knui]
MKTIIRTASAFMLGALLFAGIPSNAQTTVENKPFLVATYPSADPLKLWMNIQRNDPKSKIIVRLLDQNNRVVFVESVPRNKDKYRQRFDMSQMVDGAYTFLVTNGNETIEKTFQLKTSGIQERTTQRLLTVVPSGEQLTGM